MTLAGLEATLSLYRDPAQAVDARDQGDERRHADEDPQALGVVGSLRREIAALPRILDPVEQAGGTKFLEPFVEPLARLEVLQRRGLVVAHLLGALQPLLDRDRGLRAHGLGELVGPLEDQLGVVVEGGHVVGVRERHELLPLRADPLEEPPGMRRPSRSNLPPGPAAPP